MARKRFFVELFAVSTALPALHELDSKLSRLQNCFVYQKLPLWKVSDEMPFLRLWSEQEFRTKSGGTRFEWVNLDFQWFHWALNYDVKNLRKNGSKSPNIFRKFAPNFLSNFYDGKLHKKWHFWRPCTKKCLLSRRVAKRHLH